MNRKRRKRGKRKGKRKKEPEKEISDSWLKEVKDVNGRENTGLKENKMSDPNGDRDAMPLGGAGDGKEAVTVLIS